MKAIQISNFKLTTAIVIDQIKNYIFYYLNFLIVFGMVNKDKLTND